MLTELQTTLLQALASQWWEGDIADQEYFEMFDYIVRGL